MLIFKNTFKAIQDRLNLKIPAIRVIDLWNEEISMYRDELPQFLPAVYIEFLPVQWRTIGNKTSQHGDGIIKVHIAQNIISDSASVDGTPLPGQVDALSRFDLPQQVHNVLQLFCKPYFDNLDRTGSLTDHNHDGVIIDWIDYGTTFRDDVTENVNDAYPNDANLPDIDIEPNTVPEVLPNNTGGFSVDL